MTTSSVTRDLRFRALGLLVGSLLVASGAAAQPAPEPALAEPAPVAPPPLITAEPAPAPAVVAPAPVEPAPEPAQEAEPSKPVIEASFGKGATIRSADDKMSLNIRGRIQQRASFLDAVGDGDPVTEIVIRRMRVVLQGNALGPELTYYIQLAFSNQDMEPDLRSPLRDAYVTWAPLRDLNVRFGQMKVQYGRQRVVSSSALQMVDRSIVTGELNLDRDVGVTLFSKDLFGLDGKLGYNIGVFGGDGRNRLGERYGYLTAARLEAWPLGAFDDFVESDVKYTAEPRLAIGAGVAFNDNTNRPRSTIGDPYLAGDFDYVHAGADMMFKFRGFSLEGEVMYREANADSRDVEVDDEVVTINARSAWGAYAQAGQMLTDHLELTARYGYLDPLSGNADATLKQAHELGGGLGYYWYEHNLKLQSDYFYLPTDGWDNGTHQVRAQSQVFF